MPVLAKLSQRFYEVFGDDLTTEMVSWFNQMYRTHRNEMRGLNELNFQRFDAKLEQHLTASEARLHRRITDLQSEMRVGLGNLEGGMEIRFGKLESRILSQHAQHGGRSARLANELETGFVSMETPFEQFQETLEKGLNTQLRWMFVFWLGTVLPLAGLMLALQRWGG